MRQRFNITTSLLFQSDAGGPAFLRLWLDGKKQERLCILVHEIPKENKMGWLINCSSDCGKETWVSNILDLIKDHRDKDGWFLCQCGKHGHIAKNFDLQEPSETWEPYLRGIIPLGSENDTYQPFVFLVGYEPDGPVNDIWFSYYKDTRSTGGRLKLGYGPGGPPVLGKEQVLQMIRHMKSIGCLSQAEIDKALI